NHHQAQEITQAVFVILARKARSLRPATILPGWLFQTTRLTAANYVRTEIRRARREREAYMQFNPAENPGEPWQQLAPLLNDAIAGLGAKDRDAIVLRFLKGKDYKEVAAALGATEEASQMRVSRALEKLRRLLAKRGVTLTAAGLGGIMMAQGTTAAPAGFAATVAAGAVHCTGLTASTLSLAAGTMKLMAWTKMQFAVGAVVLALLAYQYHENSAQARQLASARQELHGTIQELATREARIAGLQQQTATMVELRRDQQQELERLRARRNARASSTRSGSVAPAPTTLLSATLQDPDAREALRRGIVGTYGFRYGPFAEELHLSGELEEKLLQAAGDGSMRLLDAIAAFTEGTITADSALQVETEVMQNITNQIRTLTGDEGLKKYEEYTQTYPARALVDQFNKQLGPWPINEDQKAQLLRTIDAEPMEVTRGFIGDLDMASCVDLEKMNRQFQRQTEASERILQKAADFLSPDQLEGLALMQTHNMSAQRRNLLRLLRKL
ncbi:MAG TPA: sigma-70 family RNA polymerase sigma factor, partial [Verrucomicrobiae bacterium]|nr:sigma-70 family RNA polymerase sigma factor [Verrucomicrobiae bacterium]